MNNNVYGPSNNGVIPNNFVGREGNGNVFYNAVPPRKGPSVILIVFLIIFFSIVSFGIGWKINSLNDNSMKENIKDVQNNNSNDNVIDTDSKKEEIKFEYSGEMLETNYLDIFDFNNISYKSFIELNDIQQLKSNSSTKINDYTFELNNYVFSIKKNNTVLLSEKFDVIEDNSPLIISIKMINNSIVIYASHYISISNLYILNIECDVIFSKYVNLGTPILVSDDTLYYGIGNSDGIRNDGTRGTVVEVSSYDTRYNYQTHLFNLDHNAGWE